MDGLLTAVKTVKRDTESPLGDASDSQRLHDASPGSPLDLDSRNISTAQIINVLKSNPNRDQLSLVLAALDPFNNSTQAKDLDIRIPSPTTAQMLQILVTTTIPDHWSSLDAKPKERRPKNARSRAALLRCLSSVAGLGSLVAQLRSLIAVARAPAKEGKSSGPQLVIRDLLIVLAALLEPHDFLLRLFSDLLAIYDNNTRRQVAWRELVSLIAGGRLLSTAAEALTLIDEQQASLSFSWLGDGSQYALWLGGNICRMVSDLKPDQESDWGSVAFLMGRALSLGYADQLVREIYSGLLIEKTLPKQFGLLLDHLRQTEQIATVEAIFRDVQKKYLSENMSGTFDHPNTSDDVVKGVSTLCSLIIDDRPFLRSQIMNWLSKSQGGSIQTLGLRRALLASYTKCEDALKSLLTHSLEQFGDKFCIKHLPTITQNANAQVILLAAGHLHRLNPTQVKEVGRSGVSLNSVSNRLAASSNRARFLGMIVGTGMSQLIDEPGKEMKFDLEEMRSEEALWYLSLIKAQDEVGSLESMKSLQGSQQANKQSVRTAGPNHAAQAREPSTRQPTSKIVAIEEVRESDEETDEDDDLIPYEKPDADASDSDEDPTLVQRNKPTAPVYIRDLITYLRDTENVERHQLAITSAPSLIRRKIGFGTELAEQIEELALTIVGLQDDHHLGQFHECRLQSLIALIVSQPLKMGRWFTSIFFDGDLSQVQRSAVLTALGLSARELAGNGEYDAKTLGLQVTEDTSFPSKRLSAALEATYLGANESPVGNLTREMSRTSLQPLAATAADALTGPNALKVRTFSSRMEVEKKRQQREAQRQKSTVKDVHKVLAEGFFYPLQGRFEIMMLQFSSTAPSYNPFLIPHILTLFLQTLSLILSTTGPHTPYLPGLTHEALLLLISLHTTPIFSEPTVTAALLALFLAVVDLNVASGSNGEERLVTEYATQVIELREWASGVFDRAPKVNSDAADDPQQQVRTLAAGVMVRLGEVMERYQGRLMGVHAGFTY